jgi:hypothetical protein
MTYDWKIALWKVIKTATLSTLSVLAASGAIDVFFNSLQTGLGTLHIPIYLIPAIAGLFTLARNYIKQYLASKNPSSTN